MRVPDIALKDLAPEIQEALSRPPHEIQVDAKGLPPDVQFQMVAGPPSVKHAGGYASAPAPGGRFVVFESGAQPVLRPAPPKDPTFQTTDPGLAFAVGNEFAEPDTGTNPGLKLVQFGKTIPVIGGSTPDINRNPYNFVAFEGDGPTALKGPHPSHARWADEHLSGVIELDIETLTPTFVPEGFPFRPLNSEQERSMRQIPRHFFKMPDANGAVRYAIPGASLKGVVRSMVEALSRSRCGELNEGFYSLPIPYRRRVFDRVGVLEKNPAGSWLIRRVDLYYVQPNDWNGKFRPPRTGEYVAYDVKQDRFKKFAVPGTGRRAGALDILDFRANLLYGIPTNHRYSHVIIQRHDGTFALRPETVQKYESNFRDHPQYAAHRARDKKGGKDPSCYKQPLDERLDLAEGDLVYFTVDGASQVDSFGKNVNYLWPSENSVQDLAKHFFPRRSLSLTDNLTMAERMFGFSARHERDKSGDTSHPYAGKIRFETAWGPEAVDRTTEPESPQFVRLSLAPLTAPQTRAKSRPLYLIGNGGISATYDDAIPRLKGRKFYWHQRAEKGDDIWSKHLYDSHAHGEVETQCPPPMYALRAGTPFLCRLHFENLSRAELGCLLYALRGTGPGHAIRIGKGKPRGMGSVAVRISGINLVNAAAYYSRLDTSPKQILDDTEQLLLISEFKNFIGNSAHLRDFDRLHHFPEDASVRYYPMNFSDYGWLPKPNRNPDAPNSGKYPPAMKQARELNS